jgi:Methyltransferase domain
MNKIIRLCPICLVHTDKKHDFPNSAYWHCEDCDFLFQHPLPPKKFEADEEKGPDGRSAGHVIPQRDKDIITYLAKAWFSNHLVQLRRAFPKTLDMGSKYPYFAHILKKECGCDAWALDAMDADDPSKDPILYQYEKELGVDMVMMDFEMATAAQLLAKTSKDGDIQKFDGISLIHVFEHIYDPIGGLQLISDLVGHPNRVFMRMPDHRVVGFENHLSPRHYQVHPYFYSEKAFRKLLDKFQKESARPELVHSILYETYEVGGGVRDYLLQFPNVS